MHTLSYVFDSLPLGYTPRRRDFSAKLWLRLNFARQCQFLFFTVNVLHKSSCFSAALPPHCHLAFGFYSAWCERHVWVHFFLPNWSNFNVYTKNFTNCKCPGQWYFMKWAYMCSVCGLRTWPHRSISETPTQELHLSKSNCHGDF